MFPLQPRDELVFGTTDASQRDENGNDLMADHAFEGSSIIDFCSRSNRKQLGRIRRRKTESRDECNIRKVSRRDIERKRRQEMSNLYASLRSVLPPERIKGKRSTCDQMQEAANYIRLKQRTIQELGTLRDKLKKLSNLSSTGVKSSNDSDNLPNRVAVNLVPDGVEILITSSLETSELGLSWILAALLERGLDVVSCVSTKTKGRFLHTIQAEARDMKSLDLSVLQERLTNAIN